MTGCGAARAASIDEWHYTIPELRQLQFAPAAITGDIRTIARNFARCGPGTESAVLHTSEAISTPLREQRQRLCPLLSEWQRHDPASSL